MAGTEQDVAARGTTVQDQVDEAEVRREPGVRVALLVARVLKHLPHDPDAGAADLLGVVREAGGELNFDFLRYLVTRFEPNDGPQAQIVGFMRSLFGSRVLTAPMVKSTAISDAGLTKQTLYEVGRENFTRTTIDRAMESMTAVNGEIEALIHAAWGREKRA